MAASLPYLPFTVFVSIYIPVRPSGDAANQATCVHYVMKQKEKDQPALFDS